MRDAVEIARNEGRNRFDTAPYEGKSHYEAGTFYRRFGKYVGVER